MPVSSVSAVRPPGCAVTVAPTIGEPSLASVTTPVAMPVGTTVIRIALFGLRIGSMKPSWSASVPLASSMPTVALRPSPGFGAFGPYRRSIVPFSHSFTWKSLVPPDPKALMFA